MITKRTNKTGSRVTLTLSGELTVDHATQFHSAMVKAFESTEEVVLKFADVERVDLTALQILYGARKHAGEIGKSLSWEALLPACIQGAADSCGINLSVETTGS